MDAVNQLKEVAVMFHEAMQARSNATMAPPMAPPPAQSSTNVWDGIGRLGLADASVAPQPWQLAVLPNVVVPREKLFMIQENLQRAEHAMASSLNS